MNIFGSGQPGSSRTRITLRSVIAGALLSLIISVGFSYARVALGMGNMSSDYITAGAICILFAVVTLYQSLHQARATQLGFQSHRARRHLHRAHRRLIDPHVGVLGTVRGTLPGVYYFHGSAVLPWPDTRPDRLRRVLAHRQSFRRWHRQPGLGVYAALAYPAGQARCSRCRRGTGRAIRWDHDCRRLCLNDDLITFERDTAWQSAAPHTRMESNGCFT